MTPLPIELSDEQLDALIERVKSRNLLDEDYEIIEAMGRDDQRFEPQSG